MNQPWHKGLISQLEIEIIIIRYEKNISTFKQKKKKQTRFPWENVNFQRSPRIECTSCKRSPQTERFRRAKAQALRHNDSRHYRQKVKNRILYLLCFSIPLQGIWIPLIRICNPDWLSNPDCKSGLAENWKFILLWHPLYFHFSVRLAFLQNW